MDQTFRSLSPGRIPRGGEPPSGGTLRARTAAAPQRRRSTSRDTSGISRSASGSPWTPRPGHDRGAAPSRGRERRADGAGTRQGDPGRRCSRTRPVSRRVVGGVGPGGARPQYPGRGGVGPGSAAVPRPGGHPLRGTGARAGTRPPCSGAHRRRPRTPAAGIGETGRSGSRGQQLPGAGPICTMPGRSGPHRGQSAAPALCGISCDSTSTVRARKHGVGTWWLPGPGLPSGSAAASRVVRLPRWRSARRLPGRRQSPSRGWASGSRSR